MVAALTNAQKTLYPSAALKSSSKSLGKTGKALEAQEVLKKKQARLVIVNKDDDNCLHFESAASYFTVFFYYYLGGLKAAAGHEKEEAGDAKDPDRVSEGKKTTSLIILSSPFPFPASLHFPLTGPSSSPPRL